MTSWERPWPRSFDFCVWLLLLASLGESSVARATAPPAPTISREAFLREPVIDQVRLSPDGLWLAFLKYDGSRADVLLEDVATQTRTRLIAGKRGVELAWSGDGRHLWIADGKGLALADPQSRTAKRIHQWNARRKQRLWRVDAHAPAFAIVQEQAPDAGAKSRRYLRIDTAGKSALLFEAVLPVRDLLLDDEGELAYAAAFEGPGYDTVIRRFGLDGAQELLRCTGVETCRLVGANADSLWILSQHGEDRLALQRWKAGSGWQTVHRDPAGRADTDLVMWSSARQDWRAVAYHGDRRRWHAQALRDQAVIDAIARQLPGANLDLAGAQDATLWLVRAQQSNRPVARHFLYRTKTAKLQALFALDDANVEAPSPDLLAEAQAFHWTASDGMQLHGYLFTPRGIAPAHAPLIAWLHGGPIARNYDDYNPAIQLLVNRGNAVFLPDFRASSGYGLRYMQAAKGDVGNGRVLADIIEGLDAVIASGVGDRDRQAVIGHSFGGYAALLAVSHHPARFRFAFAAAPPTDYGWMKQWQAAHGETLNPDGPPLGLSFRQHGFPFEDPEWLARMRRESPLATVASLRAPVYVWAGTKDDRVPLKSLVHYSAAVRSQGKPISLLIDPDGGHTPATPRGTEAWLYLIELAAHRHFGSALTPPSPELATFLKRNWRIDERE